MLVPLAAFLIVAGFASVAPGLADVAAFGTLFNRAAMVLLVGINWLIQVGVGVPGAWWTAGWRAPWMVSATLALLLATLLAGCATGCARSAPRGGRRWWSWRSG